MIKSMTAFGRSVRKGEIRDITVEVKSVNSRFLDLGVKLPRSYSLFEEKIKGQISKSGITRGKLDVYVTVEEHTSDIAALTVDRIFTEKYVAALRELRDTFGLLDDISVMSVAKHPDVIIPTTEEEDTEGRWNELSEALGEALLGFLEMRSREGERIISDITGKVERIREITVKIEQLSKNDVAGYRDRLEERLKKILGDGNITVDEGRLLTECVIFADKIAIDEELVRLRSHFDSYYEIVALPEPSGRKLDFLVQEMNRETNTIGSKANNSSIARLVVDMKGEIEKIREQVQNLE